MAAVAQQTFEIENQVKTLDDAAIYRHNEEEQEAIYQRAPWKEDVHFFGLVRISAVALVKMVMHTRSSGNGILGQMNEVMGLMMGKVTPDGTFIVTDAFPLPVEGTETRVNAGASANEYMVTFTENSERVGKSEHVCGWYHSHPGYGCWLSGIDVQTQRTYQAHQEPFLAVVIDPIRTCAAGKVEIGAFRTYPEGHPTIEESAGEYQSIPLDKIEDFGVHCKHYYSIPIEIFKNSMDTAILELLWNKYWIDTLSGSPLLSNRGFTNKMIEDCVQKLEQVDMVSVSSSSRLKMGGDLPGSKKKRDDNALSKVSIDACKLLEEQAQAKAHQVVKFALFRPCQCKFGAASSDPQPSNSNSHEDPGTSEPQQPGDQQPPESGDGDVPCPMVEG
mmetsp:Transcript_71426/g.149252  ORF Transcript_71426/g.149252 Transcript_71426/m.149252 type:complete len:389 (-) Transcript_71426:100-1266(-)|eukprot:CAMPEP_0206471002 /NCGR_PEP_ID=MMETSP0324_2-20121206/31286_1 /ASSEMBLY_ACC=CAM_ASM_000836 /TAXON_ID=2866 /ORGANISM="Crypthecodinium cohnii, Strain Seligo" /LENGTH=388 /DNA_ID=CAMNT_0053945209 /DNA_START=53 /DNA_END=1219 /DNA_ORIENTATION=-